MFQPTFGRLSSEADAVRIENFFKVGVIKFHRYIYIDMTQDKDTSKFTIVLAQSIDGIRATASWLEVSPFVISFIITIRSYCLRR